MKAQVTCLRCGTRTVPRWKHFAGRLFRVCGNRRCGARLPEKPHGP